MNPGDLVVVVNTMLCRPWISIYRDALSAWTDEEHKALGRNYDQIPRQGAEGWLVRTLSWPGKNAIVVWLVDFLPRIDHSVQGLIVFNEDGLAPAFIDARFEVARNGRLAEELAARGRHADASIAASGVPSPRDWPDLTTAHHTAWSAEVTRRLAERRRLQDITVCVQPDDIDG